MNACDMESCAEAYFRSMADEKHGQLTRGNCIPPTTNDPQAPYGETHPSELKGNLPDMTHEQEAGLMEAMERKRLESVKEEIGPSGLTAKRLQELCKATGIGDGRFSHREMVRRVIEGLITSGELMVVKTTVMDDHAGPKCRSCGYVQDYMYVNMKFCPGCGAVLIE